jgi:N-acyl amino acid synthase of PEP-CTERM/exosortase system
VDADNAAGEAVERWRAVLEALFETFGRYFEVVPVKTDAQLHQALQLRYQVYCVETGFEDASQHPDGLERDDYDARSVHSLLIHRQTGQVAGTVRLVLPNPADPEALFPVESHCGNIIRRPIAGPSRLQAAEISRFCISRAFKRRLAEADSPWGGGADSAEEHLSHRRMIPHITVGLFTAIVRMSAEHDVRYWYAVMEPVLLRFLQRFGIRFESIGPLVNYHGERQPCFALCDQVLGNMHTECYPVWELITDRGLYWPLVEPGEASNPGPGDKEIVRRSRRI